VLSTRKEQKDMMFTHQFEQEFVLCTHLEQEIVISPRAKRFVVYILYVLRARICDVFTPI
jgi:hypothetical protein